LLYVLLLSKYLFRHFLIVRLQQSAHGEVYPVKLNLHVFGGGGVDGPNLKKGSGEVDSYKKVNFLYLDYSLAVYFIETRGRRLNCYHICTSAANPGEGMEQSSSIFLHNF
jgi:hypothetical protein